MKKIQLADGLSLPLDIITMRSLVLGVSGSGKSTFGRLLTERVHEAGQRFCVIDLKNDWWGLKSTADGKHAAIPVVIFGGPRADIPLDENAGAEVANIVAETDHSFIIDLDALSKRKGIKFLGAFLERLYDANRDPLLLICDEADRYAPQKPMSPEAHVTLGAADDIARRGRKRGIGSLWLSQRPAVIAKNVTSQCELVVTFRTTSSLDLKELREHIGRVASAEQVSETMRQVAGLQNGQAILMSQHPDTCMFKTAQLPMPATFDSSATPKVGARRVEPKQLAAPDLEALGGRIRAAVEKAKADDPRELKREVAKLRGDLATERAKKPEPQRVEVPVLDGKLVIDMRGLAAELAVVGDKISEGASVIANACARAYEPMRRGVPVAPTNGRVHKPEPTRAVAPTRDRSSDDGERLGKAERAILAVLAQFPDGCVAGKLTLLAGYRWSGGFRNSLSALRSSGLIIGQNGETMRITDNGVRALGDYDPLPAPGADLQRYWLGHDSLGKCEREILGALIDAYPAGLDAEKLAERTNYEWSGGFRNSLSALRTAGLIVGRNTETMRASDALFDGAAV